MRPKTTHDFAIAIICALPLEADAVEALFDETYDRLGRHYSKQPGDANAYVNGRIGRHNVVLCYMSGMGIRSAASVATSLRVSYTGIRLALVVGICGGSPSPSRSGGQDIFLGDVIISDSVIEYDFGRQYPGGFERKTGIKETLGRPDREIRTLLNGLQSDKARKEFQNQLAHYLHALQQAEPRWHHPQVEDVLFKASYLHKHYGNGSTSCCCLEGDLPGHICKDALESSCDDLGCDRNQAIRRKVSDGASVSLHIGTVASADTVMKSGQHRDEIIQREKVIGFEMEGAGVWDNVPCLIIKGVCDYADSHKSKSWQAYAAAAGASAAKAFLEYWRTANHEGSIKTRHLMIPFGRNLSFVGRQMEIELLEDLISVPDGPRKLAITGLGGVGKTQVALEIAYRMGDRLPECSIFWIPCTSFETVEQAFMTITQMVGYQEVKPAEVKERIKDYFNQIDERWLLIFDNADDTDMWTKHTSTGSVLRDFLPDSAQGHIMFTTRNRQLAVEMASSNVIHVRELDKQSGLEFLQKSLIEKSLLDDRDAAITLLEQLTFLPLAISQAAAYINKNGIAVSEYLLLLGEQEEEVMDLLSEDFGDERRYSDMQNPVAMTWLISFRQIQTFNQLASDYLSLMACVGPRNIPQSLLPQPASKKKMVDALGLLSAYSFITFQLGKRSITLHGLVHLATRNWLKKDGQFPLYVRKAADRLSEIFPKCHHTNRQLWREYLPHALFLMDQNEFKEHREQYVDYMENVGRCLHHDGRYNEAEKLFIQVLEIRNQVLGSKHPDTLISMSNLAFTYWKQGRLKEAEELNMQVIQTQMQVLGLENPYILTSINNLASIYLDQGKWDEAKKLQIQVLQTRKQVLGPGHLETLISMNNLALTYWRQGQYKEAEELQIQVVQTRKQVLGPGHLETLISMNNLALTYWCQGQYKEAEELGIQVLQTRRQVLGPGHPDTLVSINNLASTYQGQGKWKEAEELQLQVLQTRRQVLGLEHPHSLASMSNLATTYWNQGRLKKAEELKMLVLQTRKQVLGPEHPDTLTSMNNLAYFWHRMGKSQDALALMAQCVGLRSKVLGPDNPDTVLSANSLRDWKMAGESHLTPTGRKRRVSEAF
ncbi:hypothetical protein BJX61DRAFT_355122 [Aspergillus egyptiacus]|nr:hypothetical protein BJX61DRAFT_355122 [Aspergillus egyptiacus]